MSAYRLVTIQHDGLTYTPVVDRAGRVLDRAQLARLAAVAREGLTRWVVFVLADESVPRAEHAPLRLAHAYVREALPLELGDSGLAVGRVDLVEARPRGATPGTVGRHLVARARLDPTLLADVVWHGILAGHLRGVCAVVVDADDGHPEFLSVRLGALEDSCLAGASIRAWVEDHPSDRSPADLSLVERAVSERS